jgi:hypothetical protein
MRIRQRLVAKPRLLVTMLIAHAAVSFPLNAQQSFAGVIDAGAAQFLQMQTDQSPMQPLLVDLVIDDVGGSFRIASAGKLRMLSQRISAAACNYAAGVGPEKSLEIFKAGKAEFRQILDALVKGNEAIGIIGPESRRKTLEEIKKVEALWQPFEAALDGIAAGTDVEANVAYIAANNEALLQEANLLTSEVSGEYSNPAEMTQAEAMQIDIAARQRMLTQKIAKEVCGVANGNAALGDVEKLAKTIEMYEVSLNALRDGLPEAGIGAAPTPEIKDLLDRSWEDWTVAKAEIQKVTGPGSVDTATQAKIFELLDQKLAEMIEISKLYTEFAKTNL